MTIGETQHSGRELLHRWAIMENNPRIDNILATKKLKHHTANGCIGLFYVDHMEGISLRIHALCMIEPGNAPRIVVNSEDIGEDFVLRYGEVEEFTLLSFEEAEDLSLPEEPRWLVYHDSQRLRDIRNRADLDQFRDQEYFDDVSVILLSKYQDLIPEIVWVRLEEMLEEGTQFRGELLNEPDSDFGVHAGDTLMVSFVDDEEGRFLISEYEAT